ncbi:MAG: hypothetical protein U9R57_12805 [Thermodesulfobacteriota bacterium]|nr:hypothetical protein [Thermodesulfobacteriota bacterium]
MRYLLKCFLSVSLAITVSGCFFSSIAQADVCSEGVGIPPFLSAGVDANLLLILDNSGSMLDMAYTDNDGKFIIPDPATGAPVCTAETSSMACVDETYLMNDKTCTDASAPDYLDEDKVYAGYFDSKLWYQWEENPNGFATYTNNICYTEGDLVLDDSVLWKAQCNAYNSSCPANNSCQSSGVTLTEDNDDSGVYWEHAIAYDNWLPGITYDADSFIRFGDQLYHTVAGGGPSTGNSPGTDSVLWDAVEHSWLPATYYSIGDLVTYRGMIYICTGGHTSSTALFDDMASWQRAEEGYFVEVDANPCIDPTLTHTYSYTSEDPVSGTPVTVTVTDMQVTLLHAAGGTITTDDLRLTPPVEVSSVDCFAAQGNFLNWLTASKIDIQKKILTGGKFHEGDPADLGDDRMIMEHRGCAGKGFVKQLTVDDAGTPALNDDLKVTLRVHGSLDKDWLDSTDNVTRIEFLAAKVGGFNTAACQSYFDMAYSEQCTANPLGCQNELETLLGECMYDGDPPLDSHEAHTKQIYMDAVRACLSKDPGSQSNNMMLRCQDIYTGKECDPKEFERCHLLPWEITKYDPEYVCFGQYENIQANTWPHNEYGPGYLGRCWEQWDLGVCTNIWTCQELIDNADWIAVDGSSGDAQISNDGYKREKRTCEGNALLSYTRLNTNKDWGEGTAYYLDDLYAECVADSGGLAGNCDAQGNCWAEGTTDPSCQQLAMEDYCGDLDLPEVIDPSDQETSTAITGNLPASVIDTGVYTQLGIKSPVSMMKGYIKYELPIEQQNDVAERPDGPRGVLYEVADDLRLGVMAFRDNGSKTECDMLTECVDQWSLDPIPEEDGILDVCQAGSPVEDPGLCTYCESKLPILKFCPDSNGDGARILVNISTGMYIDEGALPADPSDDIEIWDHYKNLVTAINDTRSTSWTPLAEAMYTALGYFGQDTTKNFKRLNDNADGDEGSYDFMVETEINPYSPATVYGKGVIVQAGVDYYQTVTGGVMPAPGTGVPGWTKISSIDPVQYWCQDNHILIITEGASTADINADVAAFVAANGDTDDGDAVCTNGMDGSTYFDDLTWFGQNATVEGNTIDASTLYYSLIETGKDAPEPAFSKQAITTHIVTTGSLVSEGTGECSPKTIMDAAASNGGSTAPLAGEDPAQLEENLKAVLSSILGRASAGSAASVISSSRSGAGAVYQAIFWPEVTRGFGEDPLSWVGDVHSLFMDASGRMWDDRSFPADTPADNMKNVLWTEDTDGDGHLDVDEDLDGDGCLDGDRRVFFYFDGENTQICFNDSAWMSDPPFCDNTLTHYCGTFTEPVHVKDFDQYLWSSSQALEQITDDNLAENREVVADRWVWDLDNLKRYIFTWNDLNNDGISDSNEIIELVDSVSDSSVGWRGEATVLRDFMVSDETEMNNLVRWLRGFDELYEFDDGNGVLDPIEDINGNFKRDYLYRCRRFPECVAPDDATVSDNPVWRLGDVIHSTPKLVGQPAEGFHTIYRDSSYAWFVKRHRYRRNMIYFGANDGMLHAVNGGFFDEKNDRFWKNQGLSDTGVVTRDDNGPDLGTEMWAYVPYNLQPHLKCLTDLDYNEKHKYFVDKEPRIFDMQIFKEEIECQTNPYSEDCIHPKGWGTILVGSMRFGGTPITAGDDANWDPLDEREFVSSYFIIDITDPERPPVLLGEMTRTIETVVETDANGVTVTEDKYTDLGYTTPMPTGIVMRDDSGKTTWYLAFGNGPTTLNGKNNQRGKIAILPMVWLTGVNNDLSTRKAFRIPNAPPPTGVADGGGVIEVPDNSSGDVESFLSNMVTADYDIGGASHPTLGTLYKSDAVYFGTVDGDDFASFAGDPDSTYWPGGGRIYRLVTRGTSLGSEVVTTPDQWHLEKLMDAEGPVTAGLNIGWDSTNFWIYFGTGRFFATEDKTDSITQRFFGVKEPMNTDCEVLWTTPVDWVGKSPAPGAGAGSQGLLRSDYIRVVERKSFSIADEAVVFCGSDDVADCDLSFLSPVHTATTPTGSRDYYSYEELRRYIAGEEYDITTDTCPESGDIGLDGWYRVLRGSGERVIGQAALLGGLVTYTTYQPFADMCTAEGSSNLYGVHFQTGTAWYENVFGLDTSSYSEHHIVEDKLSLGMGLATTPSMHVGSDSSNDAKVFVQTSTGEIIEVGQEDLPFKPEPSGKAGWSDQCD